MGAVPFCTVAVPISSEVAVWYVRLPTVSLRHAYWLVRLALWLGLLLPTSVRAREPRFELLVIDGLTREVPFALAGLTDGTVLAAEQDGTARIYWPNGRSRDEMLPVRLSPSGLSPLPRAKSTFYLALVSRPPHVPASPYQRIFDVIGDFPWEHEVGGEQLIPDILRVLPRVLGVEPYAPRFNLRFPPLGGSPFDIKGCGGGGVVLIQDGQLSVRFSSEGDFLELASRALLPGQTTLRDCALIDGALHVSVEEDAVPVQAHPIELRITQNGAVELVPRGEARVGRTKTRIGISTTSPKVEAALAMLKTGSDPVACEAEGEQGSIFFAWYPVAAVKTVYASFGDAWDATAHFEGQPKFACQHGGRGLFVASGRGLHLFRPVGEAAMTAGRAPTLMHEPDALRSQDRTRTREGNGPRLIQRAPMPHRIYFIGQIFHTRLSSDSELSNGGPAFRFTDANTSTLGWTALLSVQWHLGAGALPYSPQSDSSARLDALSSEMTLTSAVAAPVAVHPGPLHRRASEQVWDALSQALAKEN